MYKTKSLNSRPLNQCQSKKEREKGEDRLRDKKASSKDRMTGTIN